MTKILKRPLSILLAVLMVMSVFIAVPITASAITVDDINVLLRQMDELAEEREQQDDYEAADALYSSSTVLQHQFYESELNANDPNVERAYNIALAVYNHFNGTGSVDVTSVSRTEVDKLSEALMDLMFDYMMSSDDRYSAKVLDCADEILRKAYSAADGNSEDQNLLSAYSLASFILAQYTGTTGSYTVTWNNWDGSVLETDENVAADSTPSYDGTTPAKAEDAQNTYTFSGWSDGNTTYGLSDTLPAVSGDVTYTAVFTADPKATEAPTEPATEPAPADTYTVAGSSPAMFGSSWDATNTANDMTLSEGVYSITYTDVQPEDTIQLKVVKNHAWDESWGDKVTGNHYTFNVKSACDVTVFFDPATETVSVTGTGVTHDTELDVYSVIAVGNGEDTYLNGSIWDPCDSANALTEVADGVWELTMTDIYAFDNYQVKFAVNSVDEEGNPTSNPWAHNFGSEVEQPYPTGAAINAVYNGKNCIFGVEKDGSTVTLQLDLTNYDHATKEGAQMTIFISEPTEESTEEPTEEPPASNPAADVKDMIDALPANITLDNAATVQAARQAYDALSDTDKAQIDAPTLKKLTDAEAKIADLEAAKAVTDAINALPANIALTNKTAVQNARTAYNALTDAQKALIDANTLKKLTDAEQKITDLEAAKAVTDAINALPANIALSNKTAVQNARTAYNALTDAQKDLVDANTLKKLTDAEQKITDLEAAKAVSDQINALPANATLNNKQAVQDARAAYTALTDDQKDLIDSDTLGKLTTAEAQIAQATADNNAADAVTAQIVSLPTDVTLNDKQAVEAARAAYNALTDAQKALVDNSKLEKLVAAEAKIADLEAAKAVSDQINALPSNLALNNKQAVVAARNAYNALTNARKNLIDSDTLGKLTAAEAKIADLEAAMSVSVKIDALPTNVTLNNKKAVRDARTAYNNLTDAQKALVDNSTLEKLTDAEAKITDLETAKTVTDAITALPAAANVALTDKTAIQNARTAYNALTDAQKALVDANTLQKLTDDEQKITDLEAAKAVSDTINALPAAANVALTDKTAIQNARTAYNALTDAQKDLVDANTLKKLTDDEQKITDLEAAKAVTDAINALPATDEVTLDDKATVEAARAAYNALTDAQKDLVDKNALKKLTDDEEKLAELQAMSEVTPKTGKDVTYNGGELPLVNAPTSELPQGCTMKYALGTNADTPPADDQFTADIPTAKNAGTYYVWYKVVGDQGHPSTEAECKTVSIAKAILTVVAKNQTVNYGSPVVQGRYTVKGLANGDAVDVQLYAKISTNEVKSIVKANANYIVKKVNGILTIKGSPIAKAQPSGSNMLVSYTKVQKADGYAIFAGYCGSGSYPLAKTIKGNSVTATKLTKIGGKAIDTKKNVFLYVVAYKMVNGKKVTLVRSASLHIAGANTKYTNAKSIKVAKTSLTLAKGKTTTLKPTMTLVSSGKKLISCTDKFRYASCNKSIAKVDASGKITAVGKGTVNLYVYATNGVKTKVVVTVK